MYKRAKSSFLRNANEKMGVVLNIREIPPSSSRVTCPETFHVGLSCRSDESIDVPPGVSRPGNQHKCKDSNEVIFDLETGHKYGDWPGCDELETNRVESEFVTANTTQRKSFLGVRLPDVPETPQRQAEASRRQIEAEGRQQGEIEVNVNRVNVETEVCEGRKRKRDDVSEDECGSKKRRRVQHDKHYTYSYKKRWVPHHERYGIWQARYGSAEIARRDEIDWSGRTCGISIVPDPMELLWEPEDPIFMAIFRPPQVLAGWHNRCPDNTWRPSRMRHEAPNEINTEELRDLITEPEDASIYMSWLPQPELKPTIPFKPLFKTYLKDNAWIHEDFIDDIEETGGDPRRRALSAATLSVIWELVNGSVQHVDEAQIRTLGLWSEPSDFINTIMLWYRAGRMDFAKMKQSFKLYYRVHIKDFKDNFQYFNRKVQSWIMKEPCDVAKPRF